MGAALLMSTAAFAEGKRIAYFAASSQNVFNQVTYEGVQAKVKDQGYTTEIFDGALVAAVQYSQIEDVLADGNFASYIVVPNDSVRIAGAFEQVIATGVPIATVLFPVGPGLNTLDPKVSGITTLVASPPVAGATVQTGAVVTYCADKSPCHVVIIGSKIFPFDKLCLETFEKALGAHANIKIVAEGEGFHSPDMALTTTTDILRAHKDVNLARPRC